MSTTNSKATSSLATVEIDNVAYQRLEQARRQDESYSEVIKRCIPVRRSAEDVLQAMRKARISDSTIQAIEESAARRRRTRRRTKD